MMSNSLLVAESFQLLFIGRAAQVREYARHEARFESSVQKMLGVRPASMSQFLAEARNTLITVAEHSFPRLECYIEGGSPDGVRFNVLIRPLPTLTSTLQICGTSVTSSVHPEVKGPNISAYSTLNAEAGGEVLLLDEGGHALETTTTALVWWEGSTLMRIASDRRVASITEEIVLEIAQHEGYGVGEAMINHQDLCDPQTEVWAVNALHGIRPLNGTAGARLRLFKDRYDSLLTPLKPKALD